MKHSIWNSRERGGRFSRPGGCTAQSAPPAIERQDVAGQTVAASVTPEYQQGLGSPSEQSGTGPDVSLLLRVPRQAREQFGTGTVAALKGSI